MTGAVALDYDWDGSMDLVLYRSGADADVVARDDAGRTMLVKNTNIAADGTSLQIRIVDGNGINTFYSNTVKLYNSAGELVATQLINPQSSGSSNSMGLVSFFGLDRTKFTPCRCCALPMVKRITLAQRAALVGTPTVR